MKRTLRSTLSPAFALCVGTTVTSPRGHGEARAGAFDLPEALADAREADATFTDVIDARTRHDLELDASGPSLAALEAAGHNEAARGRAPTQASPAG